MTKMRKNLQKCAPFEQKLTKKCAVFDRKFQDILGCRPPLCFLAIFPLDIKVNLCTRPADF